MNRFTIYAFLYLLTLSLLLQFLLLINAFWMIIPTFKVQIFRIWDNHSFHFTICHSCNWTKWIMSIYVNSYTFRVGNPVKKMFDSFTTRENSKRKGFAPCGAILSFYNRTLSQSQIKSTMTNFQSFPTIAPDKTA